MNSSTQRNVVGAVMVVLGGAGFWLVRPTTTTESRRHSEATERPDLEPSRHANANVGGAPRRQTRHAEPAQKPVNGWDVPCHDADLTAAEVAREVVQGKPTGLDGGALLDGVYDVASYQVFGVPEQDVLAQSFQQTMVIEAGGTVARNVRVHAPGRIETTTWTVQTAGKDLTVRGVCPPSIDGFSQTMEYGVRGAELLTLVEQAGRPVLVTYRRRDG